MGWITAAGTSTIWRTGVLSGGTLDLDTLPWISGAR